MANYTLYQDTTNGKQKITEINEKGVNLLVEGTEGTSSTIKIGDKVVAKGVIPYVKGFVEGVYAAINN